MIPPIYALLSIDTAVLAVLSHDELEIALFRDEAPQDFVGKFARWTVVGGQPYNLLDQAPVVDYVRVQFDAFAETSDEADAIYEAIRDALEAPCEAHVVSFNGTMRDPDTRQYRVSWDMSFHVGRATASSTPEDALLTPGGTPILLPGGGSLRLP